jgi:hypothetical protein
MASGIPHTVLVGRDGRSSDCPRRGAPGGGQALEAKPSGVPLRAPLPRAEHFLPGPTCAPAPGSSHPATTAPSRQPPGPYPRALAPLPLEPPLTCRPPILPSEDPSRCHPDAVLLVGLGRPRAPTPTRRRRRRPFPRVRPRRLRRPLPPRARPRARARRPRRPPTRWPLRRIRARTRASRPSRRRSSRRRSRRSSGCARGACSRSTRTSARTRRRPTPRMRGRPVRPGNTGRGLGVTYADAYLAHPPAGRGGRASPADALRTSTAGGDGPPRC